MPTNSALWTQVVDQLCKRFTCIAVDLPGFGCTPAEPYRADYLPNLAERIEAVRIANGIATWHVVGHDAGSAVAVQYAHMFPQRVNRLVLLSPALLPDLRPYFLIEFLRRPLIGELIAPLVSSIFWNIAMRRAVRCEEGTARIDFRSFQGRFTGFVGAWNFMRAMRWGKPRDLLAAIPGYLSELTVPTSILCASRDPAIPEHVARRTASLTPGAQFIKVDSGHFIPLNRPTFVASHLTTFFANAPLLGAVSIP